MKEQWMELHIGSTQRVAIVLDASQSAEPFWTEISNFARELRNRLSGSTHSQVFFLGSSEQFSSSAYEFEVGRRYRENPCRPSLISPVLEGVKKVVKAADFVILSLRRIWSHGIETVIRDPSQAQDDGFAAKAQQPKTFFTPS